MSRRRLVLVVYSAVLFLTIINVSSVNVALPGVGADLQIGAGSLAAVSTSYLVALSIAIPAAGWLSDRFGDTRVLFGAIVLFTVGAFACGLSPTIETLTIARAVQGVGGGLLTPVGLAILYRTYPREERARVTAQTAIVTGFAPIVGPLIGGLLVAALSWRWVFLVNVPLGAAAAVVAAFLLRSAHRLPPQRLDVVGLVLAGVGLGGLVGGLAAVADPGSWGVGVALTALAVACLVVLVGWERRRAHPLLRLDLLRRSPFGRMNLVTVLGNAAFFGALYVIALFLQDGLGLDPLAAGLSMIGEAVAVLLGVQLVTRVLLPRLPPQPLVAAGLAGLAASVMAIGLAGTDAPLAVIVLLLAAVGAAWSLVFVPVTLTAMYPIASDDSVSATTLLSGLRQAGAAVGIALCAIALTATGGPATYLVAFAVTAALALAAAVAAATVRGRFPGLA